MIANKVKGYHFMSRKNFGKKLTKTISARKKFKKETLV